jgi:predicted dehydrogenase
MADGWRWGIVGPGRIAAQFADGMQLVPDGRVVAVASRAAERASAFAARFDVPRAYGAADDLAADPEVDVVYVATPHARHEPDALRFLEAGKHVLCEKPLALNAAQARRMAEAARANGRFLMEAMWSRFLPAYAVLRRLLTEGRVGEPLVVEADFGFRLPVMPEHRLFHRGLGGGALLDLGVYPLQLASLVLGTPDHVVADGVVGTTDVDEHVAAVLHHEGGGLAVVQASIRAPLACTARIAGTDGWIDLPARMHHPQEVFVTGTGGTERIDAAYEGEGLRFQVEEVHRCLAAGRTESALMPLDESIAIAGTMDAIRALLGVVYPGEAHPAESAGRAVPSA